MESLKNVYKCAVEHNPKLSRFIYKEIILENDASLPEKSKHYESVEELEIEDEDRGLFGIGNERRLPEKEDIDLTPNSDEDKNKIYDEIDDTWGLKDAKILKISEESNPSVEILIEEAPFRWITDLNSVMKYLNEKYPLVENSLQKRYYHPERKEKEDVSIILYSDEDKNKIYKEIDNK